MRLKEGAEVNIVSAECLGGHRLKITFSDGHVSILDFGPFLRGSLNPETRRFLDVKLFKNFNVTHGNLIWGDYDMCFSIDDIYEGHICCESGSSGMSAGCRKAGLRKSSKVLAVAESKAEYVTNRKKSG